MKYTFTALFLFLVQSIQIQAVENTSISDVETKEKRVSLYVSPEYFILNQNDVSISGLSLSAGFVYTLSSKWAVAPGIQQAYSPEDRYAALFTNLNFGAIYAITGTLSQADRTLSSNGWPVVIVNENPSGGWRLNLKGTQYFLNTASAAIPYSGTGLGISYEFPSSKSLSISVGADADRISNGGLIMIVPHVFSRIHFYM